MTGEPGEPVMKSFCNQNWGHSEHTENSKSKVVSGKMLEIFQITICINSRNQQRGNIWYEKNKSGKKYGNRGKTKKHHPEKHDSFIWVLEIVYKLKVGNRNRHASG